MAKSRFRILGFKCLSVDPKKHSQYYIKSIQRCLYDNNDWMMFYQSVKVGDNKNDIIVYDKLFDDENIYDTDNLSVGVCAIVGQNGSGKSTILDYMIRILNNAAASLAGENFNYAAAEHLHYIEHVYGAILYIQGDDLFQLIVRGHEVLVKSYIKEESDGFVQYTEKSDGEYFISNSDYRVDELLPMKHNMLEKLSSLFYSIVTNYSLYAYYYNDYYQEATKEEKLSKLIRKPDLVKYPYEQLWMTGLFHKNDGYQTPVVINPMRVGGRMDAPKENRLAKERILSLLFVESKDAKNKNGVYKYPFRTINGSLRIMSLALNSRYDAAYRWKKESIIEQEIIDQNSIIDQNFDRYRDYIVNYFKCHFAINNKVRGYYEALEYLVYKIIKISATYLNYNHIYSNLNSDDFSSDLLAEHLNQLLSDDTHITVKLRRVLMYLVYGYKVYCNTKRSEHFHICDLSVIEPEIEKAMLDFNGKNSHFVANKEDFLPPPIFDVEFRMVKHIGEEWDEKYGDHDIIPFSGLSSGERQVAYTVSNFAYHLVNVNSVWKSNTDKIGDIPLLKYKYVNAIFDEIEMYYHPELQRQFLSLLLNTLKDIELEGIEGVNIMLVTHSPFVLSDIPRSNVLALGDNPSKDETFGANIHEMLSQSFFMKYSIGEIAKSSIEDFFKLYREFDSAQDKTSFATNIDICLMTKYDYLVKTIADNYLKTTAKRMLENIKSYRSEKATPENIDEEIEKCQRELSRLEKLKKELSHD